MSLELPKGSMNIESYIYHGVSPYFSHWVLRSFTWYIDILWFFPIRFFQSLKTITDEQVNNAYKKTNNQGGVLGLISSDQFI